MSETTHASPQTPAAAGLKQRIIDLLRTHWLSLLGIAAGWGVAACLLHFAANHAPAPPTPSGLIGQIFGTGQGNAYNGWFLIFGLFILLAFLVISVIYWGLAFSYGALIVACLCLPICIIIGFSQPAKASTLTGHYSAEPAIPETAIHVRPARAFDNIPK